jgi:O-methyltransferase
MESDAERPKKTQEDKRPRDPEHWIRRPIEKYRKRTIAPPLHPHNDFFALADEVVADERTLLGYDRLYVLWQAARNVADLPGAVAEIGSYRGGSAHFLAKSFIKFTGSEVPFHIFDTFEGHPAAAITDNDAFHTPGQFGSGTSYECVRALLAPFAQLTIHQGDVSDSLPHLADDTYRLVHIDTDLYQPTGACLEYFGPRVCSGGVIVVDDYGAPKCVGVPKAVDEYLARVDQFQAWDTRTDQLLLIKR